MSVPAFPVSDRDASVVVAGRRHDYDGPVERHEQLTRRCRMKTDKCVYRLPVWISTIHSKELLYVVVAEKLMYTPTVNHLQHVNSYTFYAPAGYARRSLVLWHMFSPCLSLPLSRLSVPASVCNIGARPHAEAGPMDSMQADCKQTASMLSVRASPFVCQHAVQKWNSLHHVFLVTNHGPHGKQVH